MGASTPDPPLPPAALNTSPNLDIFAFGLSPPPLAKS